MSLLIFYLDGARFGLDARVVRESVWLPELTPAEEAPPYIAGIFNLRGRIVPVTDLNLRFGHPARPYRLSDQIVVLEQDSLLMGLVVSEVSEVVEFSAEAIQALSEFDAGASHIAAGEARVGEDIVTLLDAGRLLHLPRDMGENRGFSFPQAAPEDREAFRARARALMEAAAEEDGAHLALAVAEMGGEYFGIELEAVQEFCEIDRLCPIPCCPPHILGAISLRGNPVTLLDLRAALNLSPAGQNCDKAVIACASSRLGREQSVGMAVDDVLDVIYLREAQLQMPPAELRGTEIRGAALYRGKTMMVLDLTALLAREEWIVDENVQ